MSPFYLRGAEPRAGSAGKLIRICNYHAHGGRAGRWARPTAAGRQHYSANWEDPERPFEFSRLGAAQAPTPCDPVPR